MAENQYPHFSYAHQSQIRSAWSRWLLPMQSAEEAGLSPHGLDILEAELRAILDAHDNLKQARPDLLARLKSALQAGRADLAERFRERPDGVLYVGGHALLLDALLQVIYRLAMQQHAPETKARTSHHIAIMAVGGYGRGELSPASDIDLLFVTKKNPKGATKNIIEFILYLLWDMGLSVGHASRTIAETLSAAADDLTIATSLIETRFIVGDEALAETLSADITRWISQQPVLNFVEGKLGERDQRMAQHGSTRYLVEPNIKEGKGGLRDLHTLFWITKYAYRVQHVGEIIALGIIRDSEARAFASAQRFLWTVRCFLHLRSGRADDRLSFDAQAEIAPLMGFHDRAGMRGVERFMKRYFLAARRVGNLTRIFCAAIESDFAIRPRFNLTRFLGQINITEHKVSKPFILEQGRLQLPRHLRFRDNPDLMMGIFAEAQKYQLDIHPDSLRRLTRGIQASVVKGKLFTADTTRLFLEILTDKHNPERILRLMNEAGYLGKFLPDFGRIEGMMQFDMYHSYTVDEHTIQAVGMLHRIEAGEVKDESPLASHLIHEVHSRRALYVAVLLHDIAKGRGGDHSVLGAEVARTICPDLGLSAEETETVIWLIQEHLSFSKTAFRYDLSDPKTISDFAELIQSPERLKLLLVLTVADIRAVGPNIWNGWKASLMRILYSRTEEVIGGVAPAEVSQGMAADGQAQAAQALQDIHGWSAESAQAFIDLFYPSYWTSFGLDDHIRHAHICQNFKASADAMALDIQADPQSRTSILTIITQDHPGLFSRIAGAVALAGCSIVSARINTRHDGMILDEFRIQTLARTHVSEPAQIKRIESYITDALAGKIQLYDQLQKKTRNMPPRFQAMRIPPRVIVTNKISKTHTVIEVNGNDRPGLLYQITWHLSQLGLQINSASVSTYGEKAVDVFYLKDVFGLKIERETTQAKIRERLLGLFAENEGTDDQ